MMVFSKIQSVKRGQDGQYGSKKSTNLKGRKFSFVILELPF